MTKTQEVAVKLFMFQVGGNFRNSNVELHDIRFSIGETAEDCYADLRSQWWGDPQSLHLDCWGEVEQADGYDVSLAADGGEPAADRLFFVNLGGYSPTEFTELHRNVLIVARDAAAAKAKALTLVRDWSLPHKDRLFEVDKAVDLSATLRQSGYSIRLAKASAPKPFVFTCNYVPIA
ncbi:conserved hypothetical protein [uncultured Pleomorphomonas sp.]|uniref:DUF1543 domain-containing protein n=1 Tax=uncultured Pleomorphomonas sp. TaxID=442121 RepID=A0A212LEY1_9HYPH|nr:conserved hypothetical protein [uncultured Pleomorphomonas sp.]